MNDLEDRIHPVVEVLRTTIEHHHGSVTRDELQILSADPRAAELELPRQDRLQNNLPITLGGRNQREDGDDRKARTRHHEHIALLENALRLRLAKSRFHRLPRHQSKI